MDIAKNKLTSSKDLLSLFLTFLKIGAFTFGGGYAMIPLIQNEVSEKKKWITDDDILDIIAISESTPGPISVNAATFIGYKLGDFLGAFLATTGVVLPAFLIILIISSILREFQDIKAVQYAFFGIRAGVLALVLKALVTMYKKSAKNLISYIVALFAFVSVSLFDLNVLIVIVLCALIGLIYSLTAARRNKQ